LEASAKADRFSQTVHHVHHVHQVLTQFPRPNQAQSSLIKVNQGKS
jgi:hypothetical protein